MRTCDDIRELLAWYVKGSLANEEMMAVSAHLAQCAACRAELASTVQVGLALDGLYRHLPASPEDLWNQVTKQTHGRSLGSFHVGSFLVGFSMGARWKRGNVPIQGDLRVMGRRMRLFDTSKKRSQRRSA